MDEIEVLEMAEEKPELHLTQRSIRDMLRMVMRGQDCWTCKAKACMMVKFRHQDHGVWTTTNYVLCNEHWQESLVHPHYHGAQEL